MQFTQFTHIVTVTHFSDSQLSALRFAFNRDIAILDFGETRATKHQPRPKTDAIEKQG